MKKTSLRTVGAGVAVGAAFAAALATAGAAADPTKPASRPGSIAPPESVVVFIGNRLFPDFREIVSTGMHEKRQVGDTDYFFEVTGFYPQFAIIDSTKQVVSLSDEPNNPAFRIMVFKDSTAVDSSWAFYKLDIPHFSRSSSLYFQVIAFDYRGKVFEKEPPAPQALAPMPPAKPKGHP